jgi:superoxide dismutase, Cu-Zn family
MMSSSTSKVLAIEAAFGVIATAVLAMAPGVASADDVRATADISGCENAKIHGTATLTETSTPEGIKTVEISMKVTGLSDGDHAVHIHEFGQCKPCSAAGGHHDPGPFGQSRPDSATDDQPAKDINHPYHMGDLVNLKVRDGVGTMQHTTDRITLSPGRLTILDADGSAFIVHSQPDTYCDTEGELHKGCAGGARDACGVIRLVK